MRAMPLFVLGFVFLAGCKKEASASDLLTAVTLATDGKCNLTYMTHRCHITMLPSKNPDAIVVAVTAERVWTNPGERGSDGDIDAIVMFDWNPKTGKVTQTN